eukprot:2155878-Amphidinium_carterae.1
MSKRGISTLPLFTNWVFLKKGEVGHSKCQEITYLNMSQKALTLEVLLVIAVSCLLMWGCFSERLQETALSFSQGVFLSKAFGSSAGVPS